MTIAEHALIVPIGRRTHLAQAKKQIDDSFDRMGKSIKELMVVDKRFQQEKQAQAVVEERKATVEKKRNGSGAALIGTMLGFAAGMLFNIAWNQRKQLVSQIKAGGRVVDAWFRQRIKDSQNQIATGWGWLTKTSTGYITAIRDAGARGLAATEKETGYMLDKVKEGGESWWNYTSKPEPVLDLSWPPDDTPKIDKNNKPIGQHFWSDISQMMHDWLWSFFGLPEGTLSTGEESISGNTGADSLLNIPGAGNVGANFGGAGGLPAEVANLPPARVPHASEYMNWAEDQLRKEGVPEENLRPAAAIMVGQAAAESDLNPNKPHDNGTGFGIYGARLDRRTIMFRWLRENGYDYNSGEGQMRQMIHAAMTDPRFRTTREVLIHATKENYLRNSWGVTANFESPKIINNRTGKTAGAYAAGEPNKMPPVVQQKTANPQPSITSTPPIAASLPTPTPTPSPQSRQAPPVTPLVQQYNLTPHTLAPPQESPATPTHLPPVSRNDLPETLPVATATTATESMPVQVSQIPEEKVEPAPTMRRITTDQQLVLNTEEDETSLSNNTVDSGYTHTSRPVPHMRIAHKLGMIFVTPQTLAG